MLRGGVTTTDIAMIVDRFLDLNGNIVLATVDPRVVKRWYYLSDLENGTRGVKSPE
jgi:hypothetical protein